MGREFPGASYDNWKTTDPNPPQSEDDDEPEMYGCDCCGRLVPIDELRHFMPGQCNAGCETFACEDCCKP